MLLLSVTERIDRITAFTIGDDYYAVTTNNRRERSYIFVVLSLT